MREFPLIVEQVGTVQTRTQAQVAGRIMAQVLEVAAREGQTVTGPNSAQGGRPTMLAAWPITLDPIFSGLACPLIFGLLVSTLFTLAVVPMIYFMAYANRPAQLEFTECR